MLAALLAALAVAVAQADGWTLRLRFDGHIHAEPFTGRVYVFFSQRRLKPREGPDWFFPEMFLAKDVHDWAPGEILTLFSAKPEDFLSFPKTLPEKSLAGFRAQAVARFNPFEREVGTGSGNGFSEAPIMKEVDLQGGGLDLTINQLVPERRFTETKWCKHLSIRSKRLSEFHRRDVFLHAAVILPESYYTSPARRYPTIFEIPGFGGTYLEGSRGRPVSGDNPGGVEFLRVILDPSCPLGHHVFADSQNNGPVGTALMREFLPAYEASFRGISEASARFLTGHSSGGWSALWLLISYPDEFGGTWSTAPDPVDFRDFQRINLYRPGENMYIDRDGNPRPLARNGNHVLIWYRDFAAMEDVLGPGGQLHSFEAVFSPRGADGQPQPLWDRGTGAIDTPVARTWEKYDIRLVLVRNWKRLEPSLRGKIHIHMGELDTFYLEGATKLLKQTLRDLGSDAVVEIHPGKDHGTLMSWELRTRIRHEMANAFLNARNRPVNGKSTTR